MALRFSIGIVTYLGRFDTYFKPLIKQLVNIFPDYDILVFLNGHHNLEKQIRYLQEATAYLAQYPNIRYLTNVSHQPLTRAWNWLMLMAACERLLLLNDDVTLAREFRHNLERLAAVPKIFTINQSWSHFVIHKDVVQQIGWFDEGFGGIGYEDYDYIFRLARSGIQVKNLAIQGIGHYIAPATDASWAAISAVVAGKYSKINHDYFTKKWLWSGQGEVPADKAFTVYYEPYEQEWQVAFNEPVAAQEDGYPRQSLRYRKCFPGGAFVYVKGIKAKICSILSSLFGHFRRALGAYLRGKGLLGPWWEKLKARLSQ